MPSPRGVHRTGRAADTSPGSVIAMAEHLRAGDASLGPTSRPAPPVTEKLRAAVASDGINGAFHGGLIRRRVRAEVLKGLRGRKTQKVEELELT